MGARSAVNGFLVIQTDNRMNMKSLVTVKLKTDLLVILLCPQRYVCWSVHADSRGEQANLSFPENSLRTLPGGVHIRVLWSENI